MRFAVAWGTIKNDSALPGQALFGVPFFLSEERNYIVRQALPKLWLENHFIKLSILDLFAQFFVSLEIAFIVDADGIVSIGVPPTYCGKEILTHDIVSPNDEPISPAAVILDNC